MKLNDATGPDSQPSWKLSRVMSSNGPSVTSCALFTRMSTVPKAATVVVDAPLDVGLVLHVTRQRVRARRGW